MLRLQDIMTRDVVTLDPEMSLRDALDILAARHISGAPVVAGSRVIGVFSAMNAIEFLAATSSAPETDDDDQPGGDDVDGAMGSLPDPSPAYFVNFWKDSSSDVTEQLHDVNTSAWDFLARHTVVEAMSRRLAVLAPSADARMAAEAMQRMQAHRVLVMDGPRLVGIVSALDIARAVAERRIGSTRYVATPKRLELS